MSSPESDAPTANATESGFLKRWSKRKATSTSDDLEATVEDASTELSDSPSPELQTPIGTFAQDAELPAIAESGDESDDSSDVAVEEIILTDADMPPIESLDSKSDVSMFLNKGVSEALKKAAFRRLFSLPAYNVRDGLNDYDEDYTYFEPLGDTVTCDMKFHAARKERDRLAKEAELAEAEALEQEQRTLEEGAEPEQEEPEGEEESIEQDNELSADEESVLEPASPDNSPTTETDPVDVEQTLPEPELELSELNSENNQLTDT